MKFKVEFIKKDGNGEEVELDLKPDHPILTAGIILRDERYYVYQSMSGRMFNQIKFRETDEPYVMEPQ